MTEAPTAANEKACSGNVSSEANHFSKPMDSSKKESQLTGDQDVADETLLNSSHCQFSIQPERQEAVDICRVCQCAEADKNGEAALKFLGISHPFHPSDQKANGQAAYSAGEILMPENDILAAGDTQNGQSSIAINGCKSDFKADPHNSDVVDALIELGCACRNDLGLAHYSCALRWFVTRGSMICEICGAPAVNVSIVDQNKVISVLRERDLLQVQNAVLGSGESVSANLMTDCNIALATSTTREQLIEVTSWFDPSGNTLSNLPRSTSDQVVDIPDEGLLNSVSPATKWAVEGTGILIATGLLTVTITWLLAPRVNKGVARKGLNVLLGGLCALSIVVFLRFGILPRIKYGPARYWAILVVFWFLVFGVWASSTRNTRSNT